MFRANTFFRNFEIQGPADRLLIYGILWVSECLGKIRPNMSARYVVRFLGDGVGCVQDTRQERDGIRELEFSELRVRATQRLVDRSFARSDLSPSSIHTSKSRMSIANKPQTEKPKKKYKT